MHDKSESKNAREGGKESIIKKDSFTAISRPRHFSQLDNEEKKRLLDQMEEQIKSGYGSYNRKNFPSFGPELLILGVSYAVLLVFSSGFTERFFDLGLRREGKEVLKVVVGLIMLRTTLKSLSLLLDKEFYNYHIEKIKEIRSRYL